MSTIRWVLWGLIIVLCAIGLFAAPGSAWAADQSITVTATPSAAPIITSVSPAEGHRSDILTVTVAGSNFTGATVVSFGSGISTSSFLVDNPAQITAHIAVAADAAYGTRNVSVTTPIGTGTGVDKFEVTAPTQDAATVALSMTMFAVPVIIGVVVCGSVVGASVGVLPGIITGFVGMLLAVVIAVVSRQILGL